MIWTRRVPTYLRSRCTPRRSWQSFRIAPTSSVRPWMWQTRMGSSSFAIRWIGGSLAGLSISTTAPCVSVTRYTTDGAVVMSASSYSRSSRSCTISMCSRPR